MKVTEDDPQGKFLHSLNSQGIFNPQHGVKDNRRKLKDGPDKGSVQRDKVQTRHIYSFEMSNHPDARLSTPNKGLNMHGWRWL